MRKKIVRNRSNVNEHDVALLDTVAAIHRTVHALGLYFDEMLDGEVTQAEAVVLLQLGRGGDSTINDVHAMFLHKRSTLTSVIDRLERKGLLRRQIGESDRRNFALVLSAEGRRTANRVIAALDDLANSADVGGAQVGALTAVLNKIAGACNVVGHM